MLADYSKILSFIKESAEGVKEISDCVEGSFKNKLFRLTSEKALITWKTGGDWKYARACYNFVEFIEALEH